MQELTDNIEDEMVSREVLFGVVNLAVGIDQRVRSHRHKRKRL